MQAITRFPQGCRQGHGGFGSRNIVVTRGEVHLWGLVGSPAERKALNAIAECVPIVTGVVDEMTAAY